jgi:hypothetical protein
MHLHNFLLFDSQNSINLNKNVLRLSDVTGNKLRNEP